MTTPRAFIWLLCGFTLLVTSCSVGRMTAEWKENSIDGPWAALGVQVREFERAYFAGIMDAAVTSDTRWTTASGRRVDAFQIAESVQHYLKKLGYFDRWPESQSSYDGYRQRLAPFTFHIVAIDPTIVIMAPRDFGDPKGNRSTFDIVGTPPKQSFHSRYMLNYIEYGTSVPHHADILWFSPEIGGRPALLTRRSASEQELVHKRIRLLLQKKDDRWITRRK